MSTTTFLLAKDFNIYRRTGGVMDSDNHIVQDKNGFTTEMNAKHVVLRYDFDHAKQAGVIGSWADADRHIREKFPEYFV